MFKYVNRDKDENLMLAQEVMTSIDKLGPDRVVGRVEGMQHPDGTFSDVIVNIVHAPILFDYLGGNRQTADYHAVACKQAYREAEETYEDIRSTLKWLKLPTDTLRMSFAVAEYSYCVKVYFNGDRISTLIGAFQPGRLYDVYSLRSEIQMRIVRHLRENTLIRPEIDDK